jgi:hypothetical protein
MQIITMSRLKICFHNMYFLCKYVRCYNAKLDVEERHNNQRKETEI